ncbi:MAG: CarD family transcriptional regulator [Acidimicrobiia bacterium]
MAVQLEHVGGGWYRLPDGSKVQGKEAAEKAAAKFRKPRSTKARTRKPAQRRKEARPDSPFSVGDKVVHPHHGAAVIIREEKRNFAGEKTRYFVLEVATEQLTVGLPVDKVEEVGLRPVISRSASKKVFSIFRQPPQEAGSNWSRWYKVLTEKITSGDIFQVAEVVRDLTYAQQAKGISPALKRMLSKARLTLTSELHFALDVSEDEATKRLDRALPKVEAEA